ncbi:alpha/beta hydrolase family protein [Candidatus Nanohalococcus occultus]|uniref:alpha/beta hydrolase family protein n=1 Tax=Candidatus Nanohalococcus occultus TaxID=2978047 RepID=UPI0039E10847
MGLPEKPSSKHFIEVENNEEVAAVHHEDDSDKWIFFCHGFGSNKEGSYEKRCEYFQERGYNTVRFDFRGNGESDGDFIEQTLSSRINDLKAVIDHFEPGTFVLFGSSFGGKVVFHAAEDLEPEVVIGRAPVTYNKIMEKYRAVVEEKGEFTHHGEKTIDRRFYEDFDSYQFDSVVENLEAETVIFHGGADTTVHPENSFEAAQALNSDVSLHKFEGERHSFSDKAEARMLELMAVHLD